MENPFFLPKPFQPKLAQLPFFIPLFLFLPVAQNPIAGPLFFFLSSGPARPGLPLLQPTDRRGPPVGVAPDLAPCPVRTRAEPEFRCRARRPASLGPHAKESPASPYK